MRGRRIAFDYGDVRIGVAMCDPDGVLATPLATLSTTNPRLFQEIDLIVKEHQPIKFYCGRPLHLSGNASDSTKKAEDFGDRLAEVFSIPVMFIDERLTTVTAARNLQGSGIHAKEAKSRIDAAAAVTICEQGIAIEKSL